MATFAGVEGAEDGAESGAQEQEAVRPLSQRRIAPVASRCSSSFPAAGLGAAAVPTPSLTRPPPLSARRRIRWGRFCGWTSSPACATCW